MRRLTLFNSKEVMDQRLPLNSVKLLKIGERRLCLARNKSGVFAIDDGCTHAKASLSQGYITPYGEVVCPLHNYRFDLKTGDCSQAGCPAVNTYPVEETDGKVFILIPN
jgi:nitrite reductase/ring-hydroxylating ferredoxin subunit